MKVNGNCKLANKNNISQKSTTKENSDIKVDEETKKNKDSLFSFAYCGTENGLENMLNYLAKIAEPEIWSFDDSKPNKLLRAYIFKTFEQCNKQNKIMYSDNGEFCVSNTGLVTPSGKDILMFFTKNLKEGETDWFFKGFKTKVDREIMEYFHTTPELATYTENYQELYFNPNLNIEINTDHILDDNWDRIQQEIALPKSVVKTLLQGVVEEAKIKVKRNMRLVVPQFYNGTIMYLMPVSIPVSDDKAVTMALAIEKTGTKQYRANTILTKDMAYEKARLLMKPESNWLIEK